MRCGVVRVAERLFSLCGKLFPLGRNAQMVTAFSCADDEKPSAPTNFQRSICSNIHILHYFVKIDKCFSGILEFLQIPLRTARKKRPIETSPCKRRSRYFAKSTR